MSTNGHATARMWELDALAAAIRTDTMQTLADIGHEHRGHPGAALSIVDVLTALYFHVMRIDPSSPGWPDRDRGQHEFIVDGGHDRRRRDGNPGRRESVRHNGAHGRR